MILPLPILEAPAFEAAGYLPDYRMEGIDAVSTAGLSEVILFSLEIRADGSLDLGRLPEEKLRMAAEWSARRGVRPWVAVGGWERSEGFAEASADPLARRRMARECLSLCARLGLAGIDLDWEHPKTKAGEEAYADLMTTLKAELGPGLGLSAAIAGWQRLPSRAWRALDRVNVMSYDNDDRHSTFEQAQADVEAMIRQGARPDQIRLGLPFYARHRETSKARAYAEIAGAYRPGPEQNEAEGWFWNGPELIRRKAAWARSRGLAGVMVWEIAHDGPDSPLRPALAGGLAPIRKRE